MKEEYNSSVKFHTNTDALLLTYVYFQFAIYFQFGDLLNKCLYLPTIMIQNSGNPRTVLKCHARVDLGD